MVLTINRPDRRNAIDAEVSQALGDGLEQAAASDPIRCVVVTGAGTTFSAGADLRALAAGRSTLAPRNPEWGFAGVVRHRLEIPVIAAVNGDALGGGGEIVLACDLAVMDESAVIGFPEVSYGLVAAGGAMFRLTQQIPRKVAAELLLTGSAISASRAHSVGLVNAITPPGSALDAALALGKSIAAHSLAAVITSKDALHRFAFRAEWAEETWEENDSIKAAIFESTEARAGAARFRARRTHHSS